MKSIELVCFDMAGTTMIDSGLVIESFRRTLRDLGVDDIDAPRVEAYVIETMGQSKIEVFNALFGSRGSVANAFFEEHFVNVARECGVREVPGVRHVVQRLTSMGVRVALTTGFSPATREVLVTQLGWSDLFAVRVSPADAGRGRPAPDMLLTCAIRCRVSCVSSMAVVGDTASDMEAGTNAGATLRIGVRTGTDDESRLRESGATDVIDSVANLDQLSPFRTAFNS